jgi:hypothetical protein
MKKHKTMKLSDHELDTVLKRAQTPLKPATYWRRFHRRTVKLLRARKTSATTRSGNATV